MTAPPRPSRLQIARHTAWNMFVMLLGAWCLLFGVLQIAADPANLARKDVTIPMLAGGAMVALWAYQLLTALRARGRGSADAD